jgi:uncharacterized protein YecE (DUF72 family)
VTRLFEHACGLGEKFGPILYQLPANFHCDVPRLDDFLAILPRTLGEIGGTPKTRPLQHTIEFRHPSWYVDDTYRVLAAHAVALCVHDKAGSAITSPMDGPFVYVRFHGPGGRYFGRYERRRMVDWAARLDEQWRGGRDVYAYFNNDPEGMAVFNALELREELSRLR